MTNIKKSHPLRWGFLFFVCSLPALAGIHAVVEVSAPVLDDGVRIKGGPPLLGVRSVLLGQLLQNSGVFGVQVGGALLGSHGNSGSRSGRSNSGHGEYSRASYPSQSQYPSSIFSDHPCGFKIAPIVGANKKWYRPWAVPNKKSGFPPISYFLFFCLYGVPALEFGIIQPRVHKHPAIQRNAILVCLLRGKEPLGIDGHDFRDILRVHAP